MRNKYESPQMEIFKFSLDIQASTDSNTQESPVVTVPPGGGIGGGEGGYNPFG